MTGEKQKTTKWIGSLIWGLALFLGVSFIAHAVDVPEAVREIVEREFPGAVFVEIRKDTWKGHPATEVEFVALDGTLYEMVLSENGNVLSIEAEKELPWIGGELSLGLGVMVEREIYKGMDTEVQPAPFLRYENGPFELQTGETVEATCKFFRTGNFSVAIGGYLAFDAGYDPDDSDYLEGMDDLSTLYGVGLHFETSFADWELGLEALQDLSGEHDGQQIEFSAAYPWHWGGFELRPELSLTWLSEKTVDYFYGVSTGEARRDRPAYSPNSSYEIGASLMVKRPIYGDFTAVGIVEATTFGGEIRDSPLVDEDYALQGVVGVMYTF